MADTAIDENEPEVLDQDSVKDLVEDALETQADTDSARPQESADKAESSGDDAIQDPLILAQMPSKGENKASKAPEKPENPVPQASDKPKSEEKTPLKQPADTAEADNEAKSEDEEEYWTKEEEDLADSNIPEEDWREGKLSHKAKSQFLAQRKIIRATKRKVELVKKEREEAKQRYETVERFVTDQGLDPEEYANSVIIGGLIKRGDPQALPALENTVKALRQRLGIKDEAPKPMAVPTLDPELEAILKESEEYGIDTSKVRAKYQPAQQQQAPVQQQQAQQPQQQQAANNDLNPAEAIEYQSIFDTLTEAGVKDPVGYVQRLVKADPSLTQRPVGKRLPAIVKAHLEASKPQVTQPKTAPTTVPVSGFGRRPQANFTKPTQPVDPLKIAIR